MTTRKNHGSSMPGLSAFIQIKFLSPDDIGLLRNLVSLFDKIFENGKTIPTAGYLQSLLNNPAFLAMAAIHENTVIGGLTAYELPMATSEVTELFIYDIAIREDFQRQGIGKKLISKLNDHCAQKGIDQIFVDASDDDQHAVEFYTAAGGHPQKVVQFTYLLNKK